MSKSRDMVDPTLQKRYQKLVIAHGHKTNDALIMGLGVMLVPPVLAWGVAGAVGSILGGAQIMMAVVVTLFSLIGGVAIIGNAVREKKRPLLILTGRDLHDPYDAAGAVMTLIDDIKSSSTNVRRRQQKYEAAREALQNLCGRDPLSMLIRYGYYPSRPDQGTESGRRIIVNHDGDPLQQHWNRTMEAVKDLQALMATPPNVPITVHKVQKKIASLVPPLREVCRNAGIDTHRIEYNMPDAMTGMRAIATGREQLPAPEDAIADDVPADVFTQIETRMNATATMITASIRTLILSFTTAEVSIDDDDRDAGRQFVDKQLPNLIRAYIVAHDGSVGEERDQVRADFARSLAVVRDTLEGIMTRHVQRARQTLKNETRFIEMRHGSPDPLIVQPD